MLIAQLSDVHVGGGRYREELLRAAIEEINAAEPDLMVVAGDLTDEGYPDQYPLANEELSALACPLIVRVPGNHDARNVGYLHFEDFFGARDSRLRFELARLKIALVAVDSSKPDLDEGEIGASTTAGSRRASPVRPTCVSSSATCGCREFRLRLQPSIQAEVEKLAPHSAPSGYTTCDRDANRAFECAIEFVHATHFPKRECCRALWHPRSRL